MILESHSHYLFSFWAHKEKCSYQQPLPPEGRELETGSFYYQYLLMEADPGTQGYQKGPLTQINLFYNLKLRSPLSDPTIPFILNFPIPAEFNGSQIWMKQPDTVLLFFQLFKKYMLIT